jgi:hypothetical protein
MEVCKMERIMGFVPDNLRVTNRDGEVHKVWYVDVQYDPDDSNEVWGFDQYYESGKAVFRRIGTEEAQMVEGFRDGVPQSKVIALFNSVFDGSRRVKYLTVADGENLKIQDFPNFSRTGSVRGMKEQYYGKDSLLVRCGSYIYNVTSRPSIYFKWAY